MSYTIYKSDGTAVTVPDNTIDAAYYNPTGGSTGNGLGTQLIGRNAISYGAPVAQNFLQMTENFASATVPSDVTSLQGQLWFEKTSPTAGNLHVRISGATTGGIANWNKLAIATGLVTPQANAFRRITVDTNGFITATSAVTQSDIITALGYTPSASSPSGIIAALGYTPVNQAGDTMTGLLILSGNPSNPLGAATKQYVDGIAAGLNAHPACVSSTTAASNLSAATYNNGTAGVGATLTANANGALGTIGGYAGLVATDRLLVKDQADPKQNGIYVISSLGAPDVPGPGSPWVLTRAVDFDNSPVGEVAAGDFTYIQEGTLAGSQWVMTTPDVITIGTSNIVFSQLSGINGQVTIGTTAIPVGGSTTTLAGLTTITDTAGIEFGYKDVPPVVPVGVYTLSTTDRGKSIDTSFNVTVPADATAAMIVGSTVTITNTTSGSITIIQDVGSTLRFSGSTATGNRTLGAFGIATVRKLGANLWFITGSGLN